MEKKVVSGIMLTLLLLNILALAFNIQPVKAGTIIVPDDYPTIQQAINAASFGDTIYVRADTYYENVVVNKTVWLVGENRKNTIIDGGGTGDVVTVRADNVVIKEFTIRNSSRYDGGVYVGWYYFREYENVTVQNNILVNNDYGFYFSSDNNNVVGNTIIYNRYAIYGWGSHIKVVENNITNNENGIDLSGDYAEVIGNNVTNNDVGIDISSDNSTIVGNNVVNNGNGIYLSGSNNTLRNNRMSGNVYNFGVGGWELSDFINDIDSSNTVDGKPIYYWINRRNYKVPADAGYVALVNCTSITIENLNLKNNSEGLLLAYTKNSLIRGNDLTSNRVGLDLVGSLNNTIIGNNITNNWGRGIYLSEPYNNTIIGNNITNNGDGIFLGWWWQSASSGNVVSDNYVAGNDGYGIVVSFNNTVSGNSVTDNEFGIVLFGSNNTLRNNVIANNRYNFGVVTWTEDYVNDVDVSNTVDGKPIYYWINKRDMTVPSDAGYVALVNCTNITVENLNIKNNIQGLLLAHTQNSTISRNNIVSSGALMLQREMITGGIELMNSSNNFIHSNTITNSSILLYESSNNNVYDNTITGGGISLSWGSSNNSISGNNITNGYGILGKLFWGGGISLAGASNNSILGNYITNSYLGIGLYSSSNNVLRSNSMVNNTYNFAVSGWEPSDFVNDVDVSNTVDGKPIYYWINETDKTIPFDAGYVALVNSTRITVQNLSLINNGQGILLAYTRNSTITQNTIANNEVGIELHYSDNNTIYHNDFVGNADQVESWTSVNVWDDGYPSGGNYWSDYTGVDLYSGPYQNETGSDGIGDTPYDIDWDEQDRYPLMNPLTLPDFSISASPTSLTIQQGDSSTSTITITSIRSFNQPVELTVSGAPLGVIWGFSNRVVTPPPDGSINSTLTVSVDITATPGTYTLTVTGTSDILIRSGNISLEITPLPKTIVVPDDYPTIQEATNAANPADTIYVRAGTYVENVVVDKTVWLVGENRKNTIIEGKVTVEADNVVIKEFTIQRDIVIDYSRYVTIQNNNVRFGIDLRGSSYNTIVGNNITNTSDGIYLKYGSNNIISGNDLINNDRGIYAYFSDDNIISENNIRANSLGVYLYKTEGNVIYNNNFVDNAVQAYSYWAADKWDNGYPIGGNYWSDYRGVDEFSGPNQDQPGSDGIGDTPYDIDSEGPSATDHYPLMNPWTPAPDFSISAFPTLLTIQRGDSSTSTITITSIGGFDQPVQLTVSGAPSGVTTALSPESVTPPPDGSTISTLTVSVTTTATLGSYTLTVTGTSGTLTHSVEIPLEITALPPPEVVSASIDSYSISPRNVMVGDEVTISFSFTNTGNVAWTFGAGATLRRPDGTRIDFLTAVTVNPGESGSAQWTYTIDMAGRWDTVFGVWRESIHPLENLLVQTGWVDEYITATAIENQPPTCIVELRKDGVEINEIDVGEFFDIYVGDSTDDTGIKQVRFSSDDIQDGIPTGQWTGWYDWDTSSGDWDASTKIKRWTFATPGYKEVWAEAKDDIGQSNKGSANIFVPAPALPVITSPLVITPIKDIYWVEDSLTAEFTIKNIGDVAITLGILTAGGRFNGGTLPNGEVPDFTFQSVTLQPNESYRYEGSLTVTQPGNYHFFIAYYIENPTPEEKKLLDENNWNTFVQLGEGLTHADRVKNIIVFEEGTVPEEVSQLRDTISRLKRQHISYPPYLLDVDSFTSAVATLWADFTSFITRTDLTGKYRELYSAGIDYDSLMLNALIKAGRSLEMGDVEGAKKYLQKSYTYAKLSAMSFGAAAEVFDANLEAGEILAEGIKEGCEASRKIVTLALKITNPVAAKAADYIFLGVDYAVDYMLVGEEEATKNAIIKIAVMAIFDEIEFEGLGDRTISDYTRDRIGEVTFPILQNVFKSDVHYEYLASKIYTRIIEEIGVEIEESVAEGLAKRVWNMLEEGVDLEQAEVKSPVELRVYDSHGRIAGLLNGMVMHEISRSIYYNGTVTIFFPSDTYRYEIVGRDEGTYGLEISLVRAGNVTAFTATDIPTSANAIHQYTIDWDALSRGEEGIIVQIDVDGDGTFELTFTSDNELTQDEFMLQVPSAEAFPWWIVGAVAVVIVIAVAATILWRRRKQPTRG